jgi:two-component system invasion response regulator UvrY
VRIVIADDHTIVRRGMQLIVSKRPGWSIAAEAAGSDELFAALRGDDRFDVVVLDLSLGGRSGLDILGQIRRELPALPVLILSSAPEEQYAMQCIRAGARGYLSKDASADEILEAIERVASGRLWLSPAAGDQLAAGIMNPADRLPHELLSPREFEVFRSIAAGRTMTEIAGSMNISVKTASTYRTRILDKTGFRSNADIIAYAIRSNLV